MIQKKKNLYIVLQMMSLVAFQTTCISTHDLSCAGKVKECSCSFSGTERNMRERFKNWARLHKIYHSDLDKLLPRSDIWKQNRSDIWLGVSGLEPVSICVNHLVTGSTTSPWSGVWTSTSRPLSPGSKIIQGPSFDCHSEGHFGWGKNYAWLSTSSGRGSTDSEVLEAAKRC